MVAEIRDKGSQLNPAAIQSRGRVACEAADVHTGEGYAAEAKARQEANAGKHMIVFGPVVSGPDGCITLQAGITRTGKDKGSFLQGGLCALVTAAHHFQSKDVMPLQMGSRVTVVVEQNVIRRLLSP